MAAASQDLFADHVQDGREAQAARELEQVLERMTSDNESVSLDELLANLENLDLELTPSMTKVLLHVLQLMGSGTGFRVLPVSEELSTQQAADILNVSRPYLVKILEQGVIPFTNVGRHRRVRMVDLIAYKSRRDRQRNDALDDMAAVDAENEHL